MIFSTFKENFQNKSADVIYWAFFSNFSWEYFDKYDNVGRWQADDGFLCCVSAGTWIEWRRFHTPPSPIEENKNTRKKNHVFLLQTEGGWSQDQETRRTSGAVER